VKCSAVYVSAISGMLIFLSGCASYNAAGLNTLAGDAMVSPLSKEKSNVIAVAKAFNKDDCKRFLDRDVIAEGYQPIQLYIENNSDKLLIFSMSRISLPTVQPEEVAQKVHTSTIGRAVGYGVGALFIWPLAIPAIVDGLKSSEANHHLDIDYSSKAARDHVIQPHSYFNKLLFVPLNEYQPSFTVTLMDQNSNMKTISITTI
jgi:hypothetical protein